MFVGHVALALAAKKKAPELSLAWGLAAVILLDLLWPIFILIGIEQVAIGSATGGFDQLTFISYPWSHSLLMSVVWGGVFFGVARWRGISKSNALLLGLLVVSHWLLDYISHAPDMPLSPWGGPKVGLALWSSIPLTLIVEGGLFVAGLWIYLTTTRARDRIGSWAFWIFVVLMTVLWATTPWSPPPPSVSTLIWPAIVFEWGMVWWAWWVDRHRPVVA
jgi:hypothetical protein